MLEDLQKLAAAEVGRELRVDGEVVEQPERRRDLWESRMATRSSQRSTSGLSSISAGKTATRAMGTAAASWSKLVAMLGEPALVKLCTMVATTNWTSPREPGWGG